MTIPAYLNIHLAAIKSQIEGVNHANIDTLSVFVNQEIAAILGRIEPDPRIFARATELAKSIMAIVSDEASELSKQGARSAVSSLEDSLKQAKPNETTKILRID